MPKQCWEILESVRAASGVCESCPAYITGRQCWEVEGTLCSTSPAVCILIDCPVYRENKEQVESKLHNGEVEELLEAVKAVAHSKCWEVSNCSAERREACAAYQGGKNCWEVESCGCQTEDPRRCLVCPVNVYHIRFKD